jgi:hypothetical protein
MKFMLRVGSGPDGSRQVEVLDDEDVRVRPPGVGEVDTELPVELQLLIGSMVRKSNRPDQDKKTLAAFATLAANVALPEPVAA